LARMESEVKFKVCFVPTKFSLKPKLKTNQIPKLAKRRDVSGNTITTGLT
jgi:hypothetical protein